MGVRRAVKEERMKDDDGRKEENILITLLLVVHELKKGGFRWEGFGEGFMARRVASCWGWR